MLNYTIGAVKKKSTAKKKTTAKKSVAKKTRKPSAKSRISKITNERYYPSTPAKDKGYKVTSTCSTAGAGTKAGSKTAAGILALCRASANRLNVTAKALAKYGVTKGRLSRYK
jgi:hypothetical protein